MAGKYKYVNGYRFLLTAEGDWRFSPRRSGSNGKYGCKTRRLRVPEELVPAVLSLMEKFAEIEQIRRNIEGNILNTSPEAFLRLQDGRKKEE